MRDALRDFCASVFVVSVFLNVATVFIGALNIIIEPDIGPLVREMAVVGILGFCVSFACGVALSIDENYESGVK